MRNALSWAAIWLVVLVLGFGMWKFQRWAHWRFFYSGKVEGRIEALEARVGALEAAPPVTRQYPPPTSPLTPPTGPYPHAGYR